MTSFIPKAKAAAMRGRLDQLNDGAGPSQTVTVRITQSDIVELRDLAPLPGGPEVEAIVQHVARRAAIAIKADMMAAALGQPTRAEMKPARAKRL